MDFQIGDKVVYPNQGVGIAGGAYIVPLAKCAM
jgi:hypothetical protein